MPFNSDSDVVKPAAAQAFGQLTLQLNPPLFAAIFWGIMENGIHATNGFNDSLPAGNLHPSAWERNSFFIRLTPACHYGNFGNFFRKLGCLEQIHRNEPVISEDLLLVSRYQSSVSKYQSLVSSYQSLENGNQPLVSTFQLLVSRFQLLVPISFKGKFEYELRHFCGVAGKSD
jgi:hypothetical protein